MRYDEGPARGAPKHIDWMRRTPTLKEVAQRNKRLADVVAEHRKHLADHPFTDDPQAG